MRGRDLFRTVQPVLDAGAFVLRALSPRVAAATWWLVDWIPGFAGMGLRYMWVKRLSGHCGSNVMIGRHVDIRNWSGLELGNNITIHGQCYLDAIGGIEILDDVSIAHATSILSFEHGFDDPAVAIKDQALKMMPVSIGPDAWIGAGVRILAGARIGRRTVVAAGAVVKRGAVSQGIYGGVPARALRKFELDSGSAAGPASHVSVDAGTHDPVSRTCARTSPVHVVR
jgi:acetyltransferase-like isoleucine patch superfamily enzyme